MAEFKIHANGDDYIVTAKYMDIENGIVTFYTIDYTNHHVSGQNNIKQAFKDWDYVKKVK